MNQRLVLLLLASFVLVACAKAERAPLPGDSVSDDGSVALTPKRVPVAAPASSAASQPAPSAIEQNLYPPELVMENQAAIKLTAGQRETIVKEVDRAHAELLKLQWELDAEKEKLVAILESEKIDEAKSKQAAAEVMKREDAIKAGHLAMLVRIKNTLTHDQQAQLRAIRDAARCGQAPAKDAGR
jgi:Spy/CpxP family protein refolding chaperone